MDLLPYPLVRPSVQLLSTTLGAHFRSRPKDGLLPTFVDLLYTASSSHHPDMPHAALLAAIMNHLSFPRPSLTAPVYANVIRSGGGGGAGEACTTNSTSFSPLILLGKNGTPEGICRGGSSGCKEWKVTWKGEGASASTATVEQTYKPLVFSLISVRKLLIAIQSFPDAYKKEREYLEYLLVSRHLMEEAEFEMVQAGRMPTRRNVFTFSSHERTTTTTTPTGKEGEEEAAIEPSARTCSCSTPLTTGVATSGGNGDGVASTSASSRAVWWRWWEPVSTPPPTVYDYDADFGEEEGDKVDDDEEEHVHHLGNEGGRRMRNGTVRYRRNENGSRTDDDDEEMGVTPRHASRRPGRDPPSTIDIEWKDRPTFWGFVSQLRQPELVEATMQAFHLEEHEMESSAMQSNVVVQQRVLAYMCSTSTRREPAYFRFPIRDVRIPDLLSMAEAITVPHWWQKIRAGVAASGGVSSFTPLLSSSRVPEATSITEFLASLRVPPPSNPPGPARLRRLVPHLPGLCRPVPPSHAPLFLLQHYLGEDTAWRWCAEAFLHLQTGRIAKAGATNTMISGDGGNNTIVPGSGSINAPTASEELLSMERTLSSAPADLLPSSHLAATPLALRSVGSTSVSAGSSSTSISFLRVGSVYSTTLLLASLTKHWPQDILPPELLSSSLSTSLLGTAACSDYFVTPNLRMLYEMAAILFELKPKQPTPTYPPEKEEEKCASWCLANEKTTDALSSSKSTPSVATITPLDATENESTDNSKDVAQETRAGTAEDDPESIWTTVAGSGVTTMIPVRVQKAFLPVLRQTLWYFHSQSRIHDIADLYLFSSSWRNDFFSLPDVEERPRHPIPPPRRGGEEAAAREETSEVAVGTPSTIAPSFSQSWEMKFHEALDRAASSMECKRGDGGTERERRNFNEEKEEEEMEEDKELLEDDHEHEEDGKAGRPPTSTSHESHAEEGEQKKKPPRHHPSSATAAAAATTPSSSPEESLTVGQLLLLQQQYRWKHWMGLHLWLFPVLVNTSRSQLGAAACNVSSASLPLCSTSSLEGGSGGESGSTHFTLPPPPKPTGLSASAAAALSLETLLSGLLSAVMLWQRAGYHQRFHFQACPTTSDQKRSTTSFSSAGDEGPTTSSPGSSSSSLATAFSTTEAEGEERTALYFHISTFLRSLAAGYLPPRSSSSSSLAVQRRKSMASNWSYHHVVYLLVALNTLLFPALPEIVDEEARRGAYRARASLVEKHRSDGIGKEGDHEEKQVPHEEARAVLYRPLPGLSLPEMAPLLEFCQDQLLSAEKMFPSGYLTEKTSTRDLASLLLYASELLLCDTTSLIEELRLPLGAQKAKRRREEEQKLASSSSTTTTTSSIPPMTQRPLYSIYEKGWELVQLRTTQGGFTTDAMQLLLWKAIHAPALWSPSPPLCREGLVHHYDHLVYGDAEGENTVAAVVPPLNAVESLRSALARVEERVECPLYA